MHPREKLLLASVLFLIFLGLRWVSYHFRLQEDRIGASQWNASKYNNDSVTVELRRQALTQIRRMLHEEMSSVEFIRNGSTVPNVGEPVRALVIGNWRSGSTFMGDLLNSHPGAYFLAEPLHHLCVPCQIRTPELADRAISTLKNLFNCTFDNLDPNYFKENEEGPWNFGRNTRMLDVCKDSEICWNANFLSKTCQLFPVLVMKTCRLRLTVAEALIRDDKLNVKYIYLVRDPRAIMNSRLPTGWCFTYPDCINPAVLCDDMTKDYHIAQRLLQLYPERFMIVRYESVAQDVHKAAKGIFHFLGLSYHDKVREFVDSHTRQDEGDAYTTARNSSTRASMWRKELGRYTSLLHTIEEACKEAMNLWGYS